MWLLAFLGETVADSVIGADVGSNPHAAGSGLGNLAAVAVVVVLLLGSISRALRATTEFRELRGDGAGSVES